jgi:SAM-dependent methyltransferase
VSTELDRDAERRPRDRRQSFDEAIYALRTDAEHSVEAVSARFERFLPWYARFLRPWLPSDTRSRMLDVPCGAGNLLYALCKLGYTAVSGVDAESKQVELARRLGLPASIGDACAAVEQAGPGAVARIFSLDFLEHLEPVVALRFARLAHRALIRGGYFICRVPSADGPFGSHDLHNDLTHRWSATANAIIPFVQLAGFEPRMIHVFQEAPVPYSLTNVARRALFEVTTKVLGAALDVVGIGAPSVWTRSMWVVARKGEEAEGRGVACQ